LPVESNTQSCDQPGESSERGRVQRPRRPTRIVTARPSERVQKSVKAGTARQATPLAFHKLINVGTTVKVADGLSGPAGFTLPKTTMSEASWLEERSN
jgi:hypothetical protein